MSKIKVLLGVVIILFTVAFANGEEVIEAIVAIVNDDIITLSDYKQEFEMRYQSLRSQYEGEEFSRQYKQMRENLLESMITDLLLLQEAEEKEIDVSEQVKMTIENIKKENAINSDEQLKRLMRQQGINFEEWKKQVERNQLRQAVIFSEVVRGIAIDDSELVQYYNQHKEEFTEPTEYELKAVYISSQGKSKEEIEEKKRIILERLKSGEKFSGIAQEYSEGPERESGGSLGSYKKGELAKNLEQAVESIKVGEITSWVKVKTGWYLLKLVGKKEKRVKPFEEVRQEIEEKIFNQKRQQKMNEFLQKLREENYVKILIPQPWEYLS